MNANKNLDLARKAFPYNEDQRVAYMLGLEEGYDQAMQDFLEKAEKYLRKEFVDMWLRYIRGHSMDDEIKMFKNYMKK